jgi:hypothetical protein
MPIVLAVIAIIVLLFIFGASGKNIISGIISLVVAIFVGAVGLALLGTGIGIPVFVVAVILFLVIKGASSE